MGDFISPNTQGTGLFYLHLQLKKQPNVGKYTSPMDPMGHGYGYDSGWSLWWHDGKCTRKRAMNCVHEIPLLLSQMHWQKQPAVRLHHHLYPNIRGPLSPNLWIADFRYSSCGCRWKVGLRRPTTQRVAPFRHAPQSDDLHSICL